MGAHYSSIDLGIIHGVEEKVIMGNDELSMLDLIK